MNHAALYGQTLHFKRKFQDSERFQHVHLDIVGPLPPSDDYRYIVTMIDRKTNWPEAVPVKTITAEEVAGALYSTWITRYGCPNRITTDRGGQFESALFNHLTKVMGIERIRTTAYHPQSNGKVERWHRSLKAAIMSRGNERFWARELPTVLLGLRTTLRDDTGFSPAELVYGTTLKLPGDIFIPSETVIPDNETYVKDLRRQLREILNTGERKRPQRSVFVHPNLKECNFVFLRCDKVKKPLTPPYSGPYKVLERHDKFYTIEIEGSKSTVSIDRLKPAFIFREQDHCPSNKDELETNSNNDHLEQRDDAPFKRRTTITKSGRISRPAVRFADAH